MNSYLQEVVDLHHLIEARFAQGEGSVEAIMQHSIAMAHKLMAMTPPTQAMTPSR